MRSYEAARSLFSFISLFSWLLLFGGMIIAVVGSNLGMELSRYNRAPELIGLIFGCIPGVAMAIIGFFSLAMAQMGRAGVDSAEYGQQMLQIARDQLDVSRQTLNKGDALRQSFEALASRQTATSSASYAGHLVPAEADAETRPAAQTTAAQPTLTAYKGKEIAALENGFHFAGTAFPTLAAVHAYIDALLPNDALTHTPEPRPA